MALGRVVVYYAFSAGIKCRHCTQYGNKVVTRTRALTSAGLATKVPGSQPPMRLRYLLLFLTARGGSDPVSVRFGVSTTMGLIYPLKKFDSEWLFPMGIRNQFNTIFGKDCHIWKTALLSLLSNVTSPEARSKMKILSPRVRNVLLRHTRLSLSTNVY